MSSPRSLIPNATWRASSRDTLAMPVEKPGRISSFSTYRWMKCSGYGERPLYQHMVEGDHLGQQRTILTLPPQCFAGAIELCEHLLKTPRQVRLHSLERRLRIASLPGDLAHETIEEDMMARLVDDLRGQEDLLRIIEVRVEDRRQRARDRFLTDEEHGVIPHGGLALPLGEPGAPVLDVDGEIDPRRAPVVLLPQAVEALVGDRLLSLGLLDRVLWHSFPPGRKGNILSHVELDR